MNFRKTIITATAISLLLSGCSAGGGKTAVKIGDSVITQNDIKFTAEQLMGASDVTNALTTLKESFLIEELADEMDIELTDEEELNIKRSIASFKSNQGGKTAGDKLLKSYGVDDDLLETIIAASTYTKKVTAQLNLGDEPTDEDLKTHFKEDYLRAKHVLIPTTDMATGTDLDDDALAEAETKANEVLEKAKNGEDFDKLIKDYNEDPGMESNNEGYFFTANQMVSEFEDATRSIKPGEYTLCKSSYGYHIIQRLPIEGADFDRFFKDNKSSVESTYSEAMEKKAISAKAEDLGITTEVYQEVIDSIKLEDKN